MRLALSCERRSHYIKYVHFGYTMKCLSISYTKVCIFVGDTLYIKTTYLSRLTKEIVQAKAKYWRQLNFVE